MERLRQMLLQGASSKALIEHLKVVVWNHECPHIDEECSWVGVQDCVVESVQFASGQQCYLDRKALYTVLKEIVHNMESRGHADIISD